jgi:hypothetical protein
MELSVIGANLNGGGHGEYGVIGFRSDVGRSLGLKLVMQR